MQKTVVELFAGVGGFHLALKKAGDFEVVWANQWEPNKTKQHAFECYSHRFTGTKAFNMDITMVNQNPDEYQIPNHSVLVGGFPCQDYSVASTGAQGIEGKKGVLWWEIEKILKRKRPPFVLLENVDRLLKSPTSQRGRDFAVMLGCFRDLGYSVEWRVINAAEYGFAQRRRRVFIFAFHKSTQYYQQATISDSIRGSKQHIIEDAFFSNEFPMAQVREEKRCILDKDLMNISDYFSFAFGECGMLLENNIVTYRYTAKDTKPVILQDVLEGNVSEKYYLNDDLKNWEYMKGAKKIERTSKTGHQYIFSEGAIAFPDPIDKPSRTMLTSESSKNRSTHIIRDPETNKLRVLTPIECERLNGFDDDWTNTGMPEKFRYFCMGNALVVGAVEKMARELGKIIDGEK